MNNMDLTSAQVGGAAGQAVEAARSKGAPAGPPVHAPTAAPGTVFPVDPTAASLIMNHPHAAAAMAAAAAAAVQQITQQDTTNPSGVVLNAAPQNPAHLKHPQHPTPQAVAPSPAPPGTTQSAANISAHHPVTVTSAQPHVTDHSHVQQTPLSVMAALFNGLGGATAAAANHPSVPAQAAPVPYQMAAQPQATTMVAQPAPQLGGIPNNPAAVAAAAAQVVAAHSANSTPPAAMTNAFLANIKTWKLDQLESHVQLLRDTNQPIPQPIAMYLAEARRKEEKRTAKRVANRKSACTSRARKKALVEEMTRTNARLRRQALILALLPDLVIAITVDGEITFCSAQVERVLKHKEEDLVGASISDILVPASKEALQHLIEELVAAERAAASADNIPSSQARTGAVRPSPKKLVRAISANGNGSAQSSSASAGEASSGGAAVVSDQSFPLSVVKVKNRNQESGGDSDLSTSNGGKQHVSSITNNSMTTNSSFGNQSDEAAVQANSSGVANSAEANQDKSDVPSTKKMPQQQQTSSDDSLSSSSDIKNLRKANEALSQNVRWHNEKLLGKSKTGSSKNGHKDDVTGASVTANNADARLSSLQHHPSGSSSPKKSVRYESLEEQSSASSSDSLLAGVEEKKKRRSKHGIENSSEDSGYRESNDSQSSPEDTSDSSSDNKDRVKPLAPTCNVCLIRDDLTTVWCEVTSSIRTRSVKEATEGNASGGQGSSTGMPPSSSNNPKHPKTSSGGVVKELLLCLRPIRDGEEKVDESLRFVPSSKQQESVESGAGESNLRSSSDGASNDADSNARDSSSKSRPPKKRPIQQQQDVSKVSSDDSANVKRSRVSNDAEKSVIESLILMSHKSTNA